MNETQHIKNTTHTIGLGRAFFVQVVSAMLVIGASIFLAPAPTSQLLSFAILQGLIAALLNWVLRYPIWWLPIHLFFAPIAVLAQRAHLPSWTWLTGFVVLLLIFWRTDKSRVPLYLSNTLTSEALAKKIPNRSVSIIDLGCGDGRLLRRLAQSRPDCRFTGYEHAPLTFVWAWLAGRRHPNLTIHLGNFWNHSLSGYEIVYAFLSPSPMTALWEKFCHESQPGNQLISNSFAIHGIEPTSTTYVNDGRKTLLFCYEAPSSPSIR